VTWTASYSGGGGGDVCTVSTLGAGVRVSWQNKPGNEVLRNSAGWVATPPPGTLNFDAPNGALDDGWLIRRSGVSEVCEIEGNPPPPPGSSATTMVGWRRRPLVS